MSSLVTEFETPERRELDAKAAVAPFLILNPWTVQNIVYEILTKYFTANPPETAGFTFKERYDADKTKSQIFVDLAYHWDKTIIQERPAIFVQRGQVELKQPTFRGSLGSSNFAESEYAQFAMNNMQVIVKCIGTNVGFTEQLAEYAKQALLYYEQEIQRDFGLSLFRLRTTSPPEIVVESKEHFAIMHNIHVAFAEGWIIKGDDLKLKRVAKTIFDAVTKQPLMQA